MKRKYDVQWADTAEKDVESIAGYIANDNVDEALRVLEIIRGKAAALSRFPDRGRVVPELKEQGITLYRELVFSSWRLLYRIAGTTVYVLAVFDSRRNLEDILLNRFLAR